MDAADIQTLYRYHDWANQRMLDAVRALPPESLTRDLGGSFRSIRDLVAHVVGGEWVWLERWKGLSPKAVPGWFESGDVAELTVRLGEIASEREAYVAQLSGSALAEVISFRYLSGREGSLSRSHALLHVANHSTYHRGQLAWMLRQLGAVPPATDFTVFLGAGNVG